MYKLTKTTITPNYFTKHWSLKKFPSNKPKQSNHNGGNPCDGASPVLPFICNPKLNLDLKPTQKNLNRFQNTLIPRQLQHHLLIGAKFDEMEVLLGQGD